MQSASNHGVIGQSFYGEGYNPTEGGTAGDHSSTTFNSSTGLYSITNGPSTSVLTSRNISGQTLSTTNQMAFYRAPSESTANNGPAYNTAALSNFIFSKQVTIGHTNAATGTHTENLIHYKTTWDVSPVGDETFDYHQFATLSMRFTPDITVFFGYDPLTGSVAPVSPTSGASGNVIIASSPDGSRAIGLWGEEADDIPAGSLASHLNPVHNQALLTAVRADGTHGDLARINTTYRYGNHNSDIELTQTHYEFDNFVAVGTLADVTAAFDNYFAVPEPSAALSWRRSDYAGGAETPQLA